jgi:hypothetical protein
MGKALVLSKTFWGSVLAALPAVSEALNQAVGSGFLPPQAMPWVAGVGAVLAFLGRITASEEITSVFPK